MTTVIHTERPTKTYGAHGGITELDLEVAEGEIFGFLGPNGAGNATTMRVLLDLIRPTRGRAEVFGIETTVDPVAIHRRIGYLPGEFDLYDRVTGSDTLGNDPGDAHCRPTELIADEAALARFRGPVESRGLEISALSFHGNPLHPQPAVARASHETFVRTNLFSGCPGDSDRATYPNWVTCAWPNEYGELLEWQWREKVIPYWREQASLAAANHIRLGFEMLPGFVVYNARPLLRLRVACGEAIGADLDPSHLLNGVLDTVPMGEVGDRSWIFRTVGYGHGELDWRRILTALRMAGYDDVLSIEHKDALFSIDEGFRKGVAFLRSVMPTEPALTGAWWT